MGQTAELLTEFELILNSMGRYFFLFSGDQPESHCDNGIMCGA